MALIPRDSSGDNMVANILGKGDTPHLASGLYRKGLDQEARNIDSREFPEEWKLSFEDGRRIDFVLSYDHKTEEVGNKAKLQREIFQRNLEREGLALAFDKPEHGSRWFVMIHAPWEVLSRYADIMKIRMPMKEVPDSEVLELQSWWDKMLTVGKVVTAPFHLDPKIVPPLQRRFTCVYSKDKDYLFDITEKDLFFSNTQRSRIVDYILRRQRFTEDTSDSYSFGIRRLINDKVYTDCFPLHEGWFGKDSQPNLRKLLYDNWASWRSFHKEQPLDYIRNYFGEKIGLYFAWLGFYTTMLFPAALVGLIVFIYGCATIFLNPIANEICHPGEEIIMCPLCDLRCDYWNVTDACMHARVSYLFDNGATFFFAIFMSVWGTIFLEMWKRTQAEIQFKWSLSNFEAEEEPARPEFLAALETGKCRSKKNYISGLEEPHFPFLRRRVPIFCFSFSIMILLVLLALVFVIGVIAYRMCVLAVLYAIDDEMVYRNASLFTSLTAAVLNLIVIFLLNFIYRALAEWLTNLESLRTQTEFDDSLTLKLYLLQFVNYYSSLFYIAFFKGRFTGQPNEYKRLFNARQEECMPGGCLIELCLQLFVIMVGKQFVMSAIEIIMPKLSLCFARYWKKETAKETEDKKPWELDQELIDPGPREIFFEYLEMLLQFGFITIFVAAFPLAPLFALLNNIVEIRGDAQKFVCDFRRPVAHRKQDIGIWYDVLFAISRLAIITNALIIAFTSDFIPRLVYREVYSKQQSYHGFINNSLSYFQVQDFENDTAPLSSAYNVSVCRYKAYTNPPSSPDKYDNTQQHWHVMAGRILFVAVFENFVVVLTSAIAWMIPDIPVKLAMIMRRENYITNEIILQTELHRAQGLRQSKGQLIGLKDIELIRKRANDLHLGHLPIQQEPDVTSDPTSRRSRPVSINSETCV